MKANKRSGIKKGTIRDVHQDMNNLCMGSGVYETPLNALMPLGQKFILLETASGRVGKSLSAPHNESRTYAELIRTATLALAWAQGMKKGQQPWTDK